MVCYYYQCEINEVSNSLKTIRIEPHTQNLSIMYHESIYKIIQSHIQTTRPGTTTSGNTNDCFVWESNSLHGYNSQSLTSEFCLNIINLAVIRTSTSTIVHKFRLVCLSSSSIPTQNKYLCDEHEYLFYVWVYTYV